MKELKKNMTSFNVMLAKEFDPMNRRLDIKNFIQKNITGNLYTSRFGWYLLADRKCYVLSKRSMAKKNKTIDLTEYYNLAYQYKNDCLTASIEYDKEYYSDKDIRPNESLLFKLKIIPFNRNNNLNF